MLAVPDLPPVPELPVAAIQTLTSLVVARSLIAAVPTPPRVSAGPHPSRPAAEQELTVLPGVLLLKWVRQTPTEALVQVHPVAMLTGTGVLHQAAQEVLTTALPAAVQVVLTMEDPLPVAAPTVVSTVVLPEAINLQEDSGVVVEIHPPVALVVVSEVAVDQAAAVLGEVLLLNQGDVATDFNNN